MIAFHVKQYRDDLTLIWEEPMVGTTSEWTYVTDIPNDSGPTNEPMARLSEDSGIWDVWVEENQYTARRTTEPIGLRNWQPTY